MRRTLLFCMLLSSSLIKVNATIYYTNLNATGTNNGTSWVNAYTNFQTAINNASSGDSVFVAQGIYQPVSGGSFNMKEGVKIFGGFLGSETDFSQRNLVNKATLQGNGNSVISNSGNGLTAAAVLDGFIITGGYANTNTNGGHGGGGIYNQSVSPKLRHLVITGNGCNYYGGGIEDNNGSTLFEDVIIKDNTASNGGGGISLDNSSVALINVLISGNSAYEGGGIWSSFGSVTLANVTVTGNTANETGGIYAGADFAVYNSIIWGNSAVNVNEFSTDFLFGGSMSLHHSLYRDGTANVNADFGALTATDNDLTVNPQFVDSAAGNYQLTATSPCIDAGTPDTTGLNIGNTDVVGNTRITGSAVDIGAYEFNTVLPLTLISFAGKLQNSVANLQWQTGVEDKFNYFELQKGTDGKLFSTFATLNAKGDNSHYATNVPQTEDIAYYRLKTVDNDGKFTYSKIIILLQNTSSYTIVAYPNPAKDYINVESGITENISIYDISGILVKTASLQKGLNKIDISTLSTGTYFITSGNQKMKFIRQ